MNDDLRNAAVYPQDRPDQPGASASAQRIWTVHDQGRQFGPYAESEIASLLATGAISLSALVWKEGSPQWVPVTAVIPMPAAAVPMGQAYPALAAPPDSNKIAAGICGILLGSFGVHKFILGFTGAGLIMLLSTLLTCGIAAAIMHVIGIIEGIIYLSKSDAEFYQDYVVQRRSWF